MINGLDLLRRKRMVEVDEFSDVEIFGFEHGVITPPVANGDVAAGKNQAICIGLAQHLIFFATHADCLVTQSAALKFHHM